MLRANGAITRHKQYATAMNSDRSYSQLPEICRERVMSTTNVSETVSSRISSTMPSVAPGYNFTAKLMRSHVNATDGIHTIALDVGSTGFSQTKPIAEQMPMAANSTAISVSTSGSAVSNHCLR